MDNSRKKITLKQIGLELGYSPSTISKALKNSTEIGKDTRATIQAFAKYYNYQPNHTAISLLNGRTQNIGVIFPSFNDSFFSSGLCGIEKFATDRNYNISLCISNESLEQEMNKLNMLSNINVDGFIVCPSAETLQKNYLDHINGVTKFGKPMVLFERVIKEVECDKVTINNRESTYLAVQRLRQLGRKKIAMITPENTFYSDKEQIKGFKDALKDYNLNESLILELPQIDLHFIKELLGSSKLDALLCANEDITQYLVKLIKVSGLHIPSDISIIGYSNGELSKYIDRSVITISRPGEHVGRIAAKILLEKIENTKNRNTHITEIIKTKMIEMESKPVDFRH